MNLLSSASTNSLNNFYNNSTQWNKYTNSYQSNVDILKGISTYNSATNSYTGFSMSIFSNSSGIGRSSFSSNYSSYNNPTINKNGYNSTFGRTGNDGLNYNRPYATSQTTIPTSVTQYGNGKYGSSLMGNFITSIQHVGLGQYAPTSVFEQRLNYTLPYEQQAKPGSRLGDTSDFFNTDSVAKNQNSTTGYNVFSTNQSTGNPNALAIKQAAGATTVSGLMSALSIMA